MLWDDNATANKVYGSGQLLECRPNDVTTGIQFLTILELGLPMSFDYLTCDFQRDTEKDLESAER